MSSTQTIFPFAREFTNGLRAGSTMTVTPRAGGSALVRRHGSFAGQEKTTVTSATTYGPYQDDCRFGVTAFTVGCEVAFNDNPTSGALSTVDVNGNSSAGNPVTISFAGAAAPGQVLTAKIGPGLASRGTAWFREYTQVGTGAAYIRQAADDLHVLRAVALGTPYSAEFRCFPDATAIADFENGVYFGGALGELLQFARSTTKTDLTWDSPPNYAYKTFAIDVPAIIPGKGMLVEETRNNVFLNPLAPATQSITLAAGTYPVWLNGPVGASLTIAAGTAVVVAGAVVTHGAPFQLEVLTTGTVSFTVAGTPFFVQVEQGGISSTGPTSAIVNGTRTYDDTTWTTSAVTGRELSAEATYVEKVYATTGTPNNAGTILCNISQTMSVGAGIAAGFGNADNGSSPITWQLGAGNHRDAIVAMRHNSSERTAAGNGGLPVTGARLNFIAQTYSKAGTRGNNNTFNGYIARHENYPVAISVDAVQWVTTRNTFQAVYIGTSLAARSDGPGDGTTVPQALGAALNISVLNAGFEGTTSTAAAARYAALAPALRALPLIIEVGRNDFANSATLVTNIQTMRDACTSPYKMVLTVEKSQYVNEQTGGSVGTQIDTANTAIKAITGVTIFDLAAFLVTLATANPCDVVNASEGRVPYTARLDNGRITIPGALDASQTTFTTSAAATSGTVLLVDSEYIFVQTSSGNNVTASVRGYAGTAATHAAGVIAYRRDPVHWDVNCRKAVGAAEASAMRAAGWVFPA